MKVIKISVPEQIGEVEKIFKLRNGTSTSSSTTSNQDGSKTTPEGIDEGGKTGLKFGEIRFFKAA